MSLPSGKIPLFLAGARGLLAGEFLRLLHGHPAFSAIHLYSRLGGEPVQQIHPHLSSTQILQPLDDLAGDLAMALQAGPAVLVLALPHGASKPLWKILQQSWKANSAPWQQNLYVVDFSEDFRLTQESAEPWQYGLPELHRQSLSESRLTAAPGCFATAMQLAVLPAASNDSVSQEHPWMFHGVTGSSGSGAEPKPGAHHPFRHQNLWAYSRQGHRHEKELLHSRNGLGNPSVHFFAYSGPFSRGIHLTAHLPLKTKDETSKTWLQQYREFYQGCPFVQILEQEAPSIRAVAGSNRADVQVMVRDAWLHVFLALDNTLKGGAGQALQSLNLMLGYPESTALPLVGHGY